VSEGSEGKTMFDFKGKVAVVTGGGSGIGAAMAKAFAAEGSRIVLADLDAAAMEKVAGEIAAGGGEAVGVRTDVTRLGDVEALAERAVERFGAVHIICNNAGVGVFGPLAGATHRDWQWVLNVNLWGVVHGVEVFLPRLLKQNASCHIVNTASMAGLAGMPSLGIYCASKFAVVGLTESLHRELHGSGIGASVLCPMIVNTAINQSERNRPVDLRNPEEREATLEGAQYTYGRVIEAPEVAQRVVEAIRDNELYILTHRESHDILRRRAERLERAVTRFATA
jgi:NAD(P)-dependent dehydrogenase (short-subunit alcohol dehydrogenase family)